MFQELNSIITTLLVLGIISPDWIRIACTNRYFFEQRVLARFKIKQGGNTESKLAFG